MARLCDDIELFVDGELPPERAEAFRQHLPECIRCQRELADLVQLKLMGSRHAEGAAAHAPAVPPRAFFPGRWMRQAALGVAVLALPVLWLLGFGRGVAPAPVQPQHDVWLAGRPQRLQEARLSYPEADRYRPLESRALSSGEQAGELSNSGMASLAKDDVPGKVAALLALNDRGQVKQVLLALEKWSSSPDRESAYSAAMLLNRNYEESLRRADRALAYNPHHSQALWNRGLALRELGLPLMASRAFSEVASLGEPGWATEATEKAEQLKRKVTERRERWEAVVNAGRALRESVPGSLPESFGRAPIARLYFYDAVRTAPSRERVLSLLDVARELDAWAGGDVLASYVRRVAAEDFSQRAPLSRDYAALVTGGLSKEQKGALVARLLQSKEQDILLGALVLTGQASRHLERFQAYAAANKDPWFELLAAQERAQADHRAGRFEQALQALQEANRLCPARGLEYRCLSLRRDLSGLHIQSQQFDAAREYLKDSMRWAREGNEWALERDLLWQLAQVARFGNDESLARAFYQELLARDPSDSVMVRSAHQNLAEIALHEFHVDEARQEMNAALATGQPLSFSGALPLADISRMRRAPGDEGHLVRSLEEAKPRLSPGERAIATHVLGRFYIEQDVERGRALLWSAIKEVTAPGMERDPAARRARAYSFTSLLLEAGRRGAFEEALELFAREWGGALPRQCLLAATVDSERTLLIARGAAGEVVGSHDEARRQPLPERLDGLVPEALLASLRACPQVVVLARPPLHGKAGLLPSELAWSYLTHTADRPLSPPGGPVRHLVVSDVEIPLGPEYEELERSNAWVPSFGPGEVPVTLSGAEATPERVLAAMQGATEIDVMAHGITPGAADAAYLLLAPGLDGPKLQVERVRTSSFHHAPFVVLASCYAAQTAYALQEPLSLPAGFIQAGARGVLAATEKIPDREAAMFFGAVRTRMREGTPAAIALRDERIEWLRKGNEARWLESVLLFE